MKSFLHILKQRLLVRLFSVSYILRNVHKFIVNESLVNVGIN